MRRVGLLALAAAALLGSVPPARAGWGADVDPETAAELVEWLRPDLAEIVAAPPDRRPALVSRFVTSSGVDVIEGLKRFRNPELLPLFHVLLEHGDWHVAHRALLALERCEDPTACPKAFGLLAHEEPRLREKAAISCLRLWAPDLLPADAAARVDALARREPDPHVRSCLRALASRAAGTLHVEKLVEEVRIAGPDGLLLAPLLRKMSTAGTVAPGTSWRRVSRRGDGSAAELPVAARWTTPLLRYGEEQVPAGRRLQPFGFLRNGGDTCHTGVDVGALLDGAGLYACAEGVVKLVYTGSDMGTEIVLEHHAGPELSPDGLLSVVYMHAADVVFVAAGDRVVAGQLLGSMGMGYSFENGGHFAHLHLGMYPGPFQPGHNYGYRDACDGLADWLDPDVVLRTYGAR